MSALERYDAVAIGAGQAGGPPASAPARNGERRALIEREHYYRIIRTSLLQGGRACITDRALPYGVFIDPQLGRMVDLDFAMKNALFTTLESLNARAGRLP